MVRIQSVTNSDSADRGMINISREAFDRMHGIEERLASVMYSQMTQRKPKMEDWGTDQILAYIWDGTMPESEDE